MKSDAVKRSVKSPRYDRDAGDAPALGRIARMSPAGSPHDERRRRRRGESRDKHRSKLILYWSIGLGLLTLLLIGVVFLFWLSPQLGKKPEYRMGEKPERVIEETVSSRFISPTEQEAVALVKSGLAVNHPDKVPDFFIVGKTTAQEVVDFLQEQPAKEGVLDQIEWRSSTDANDLRLDALVVHRKKDGKDNPRIAFLTPNDQGVWKIDFEAFARTVRPSWQEIFEKNTQQAVVRVVAMADSYYNGPFSDEKVWACYNLGSWDTDKAMIGYCKIGSPQAEAMDWIFAKGGAVNRVTLEITRVEGAASKQFQITKVLAQDWVLGPKSFDESYR